MAMGPGQAPAGAEGEGVSERETGAPLLFLGHLRRKASFSQLLLVDKKGILGLGWG